MAFGFLLFSFVRFQPISERSTVSGYFNIPTTAQSTSIPTSLPNSALEGSIVSSTSYNAHWDFSSRNICPSASDAANTHLIRPSRKPRITCRNPITLGCRSSSVAVRSILLLQHGNRPVYAGLIIISTTFSISQAKIDIFFTHLTACFFPPFLYIIPSLRISQTVSPRISPYSPDPKTTAAALTFYASSFYRLALPYPYTASHRFKISLLYYP